MLSRVTARGAARAAPDFARLEAQLAEADPRLIVVEGGDGTVQAVTTAVMRRAEAGAAPPRLLLVPGGMTDLVARVVGVGRDPRLIERLIEGGGRERSLRPLRVEHEEGLAFGYFLATGAVPRGIAYARERVQSRGAAGALAVAGAIGGVLYGAKGEREAVMAASPMRARLDDEAFGPDHRFALVTTLPRLMLGLDPFWGGGEGPVRVTLARGDNRRLKRSLLASWAGLPPRRAERDGYVSRAVRTLRLDTPAPIVLDGEALPSGVLAVTAGAPLTFVTA